MLELHISDHLKYKTITFSICSFTDQANEDPHNNINNIKIPLSAPAHSTSKDRRWWDQIDHNFNNEIIGDEEDSLEDLDSSMKERGRSTAVKISKATYEMLSDQSCQPEDWGLAVVHLFVELRLDYIPLVYDKATKKVLPANFRLCIYDHMKVRWVECEIGCWKTLPPMVKALLWNLLKSAHDVNIGTSAEITLKFEKVANQNILDSYNILSLAQNSSISSISMERASIVNQLDLDDFDIYFDKSNL
eukprot:scaffold29628_cov72-Attheya_sp.AAC.2